ncbi:hypothetical protein NDU88_000880 [Pleurodeles waltl]|uniref:Uncharacterized protein n=1 Tax=Pleurodeles waltl TaxID=8319 RepID=A0AAV7SAX8_PLEWA|nr:hypothetical protein NDU88_000880 [Pleurodeles waltl]
MERSTCTAPPAPPICQPTSVSAHGAREPIHPRPGPASSPPNRDPRGPSCELQHHRLPKMERSRGPSSVSQQQECRDQGRSRVAATRQALGPAWPRLSTSEPLVLQGNPRRPGLPSHMPPPHTRGSPGQ